MTPATQPKASTAPALGALGAALALIVCCLLVPALIGAAWLLAVGTAVEAALIASALALGTVAIRRRRSARDRASFTQRQGD